MRPHIRIDPIRYESHQPPLYYLLATPVFLLGRALGMETPLLPLRLFSMALGLASLLVAYRLVRTLVPGSPRSPWERWRSWRSCRCDWLSPAP